MLVVCSSSSSIKGGDCLLAAHMRAVVPYYRVYNVTSMYTMANMQYCSISLQACTLVAKSGSAPFSRSVLTSTMLSFSVAIIRAVSPSYITVVKA
jgi:hypothetical protein